MPIKAKRIIHYGGGERSSPPLNLEGLMAREVQVGNTTFIVNSYSRKGATETVEQILKRVIVQNAEKEFKSCSISGKNEGAYCRKTT